ncbi:MAG TPA: DUF1566 domain-containing protein, partial [Candidatus Acidoferrales bacterium]|nr:DUF1566 domain-containing protein [Candidatus Acidoferrales bacterium]
AVMAKDAKGVIADGSAVFLKCRHAYFKKWTAFQSKASLAGSTCNGSRYGDNGDQTVTDNLTGLTWEKKNNLDLTPNLSDPHDADNTYTWCTGPTLYNCTNPANPPDGGAFTDFLLALNSGGFAGANGWRLPTITELQTIVLDFACKGAFHGSRCTCPSLTCVDPALDSANTSVGAYWSATSYVPDPSVAWLVSGDSVGEFNKPASNYAVRAVRGGL